MPPVLDPAILKALKLDAATTTIASHGGSGFSSTAKLTSKVVEKDADGKDTGTEKLYFVKIGKGKDSGVMFAGRWFPSRERHDRHVKFYHTFP